MSDSDAIMLKSAGNLLAFEMDADEVSIGFETKKQIFKINSFEPAEVEQFLFSNGCEIEILSIMSILQNFMELDTTFLDVDELLPTILRSLEYLPCPYAYGSAKCHIQAECFSKTLIKQEDGIYVCSSCGGIEVCDTDSLIMALKKALHAYPNKLIMRLLSLIITSRAVGEHRLSARLEFNLAIHFLPMFLKELELCLSCFYLNEIKQSQKLFKREEKSISQRYLVSTLPEYVL
jgi:hypothetical protein